MKSELTTPLKNNLDLSSSPTDSSDVIITKETSPASSETNAKEIESLSHTSKKIRKKRTAYHKIDDNIRIQLLEAVKNGETLKSIAKKYNINYSSAKSVLHTYRKEGRILKKSGQETNSKPLQYVIPVFDNLDLNSFKTSQPSINLHKNLPSNSNAFQNIDLNKLNPKGNIFPFGSNPADGVNLLTLLKLNSSNSQIDDLPRMKHSSSSILPKISPLVNSYELSPMNHNTLYPNKTPANSGKFTQLPRYDNLYRKYPSSPLSVGDRMTADSSEFSENRTYPFPKEIQSFSEMVNALQGLPFQQEKIYSPCEGNFDVARLLQNGIEPKMIPEGTIWPGKIGNAAIDTYKTFMDAQELMHKALEKASFLNNLMQFQQN